MNRFPIPFLFAIAVIALSVQAQELKTIVRLDPGLDNIVPADAKVEKVADDLLFLEGPVWVRREGYLIFSDIPANVIYRWTPKDRKPSVFLERSGFTGADPAGVGDEQNNGKQVVYNIGSNGVTVDPRGRVVFCANGDRQIVRLESDGRRTILASKYEGKRFNGPNDLVFKSNGSLYFTDSPGGLRGRDKDPKRELPFFGVYLLKGGKLQVLLNDPALRPNGIAIDPTEKYLYVNDNATMTIRRFDLQPDDTIANGKVFLSLGSRGPGGTKIDKKGNVYNTGTGGVWVNSAEGKHLGTIPFPQDLSNLAFGDKDGRTLYATGRTALYRIRLKIPGMRP